MPVLMTEEEKSEYKQQLEVKHVWQLDSINTTFTTLLDFQSKERHKQKREQTSQTAYMQAFKKGLQGEGPEDYSLSHKLELLNRLKEKVNLFNVKC